MLCGLRNSLRLLFLCSFLFSSGIFISAHAEFYQLYDSNTGRAVDGYATILSNLKEGDVISFTNQKRFKIKKFLGSGNTTMILELEGSPPRAIRLPKNSGSHSKEFTYGELLDSFVKGARYLEENAVPSVKIHESLAQEYAIVDKVNVDFTFGEFLKNNDISESDRKKMIEEFYSFAKKTARLEKIGDFHPGQLVYDGKKWIVLDWTSSNSKVIFDDAKMVLESPSVFIEKWYGAGERLDFFDRYATQTAGGDGKIQWIPKEKKYEWISDMANSAHQTVMEERLKILASEPRVIPSIKKPESCIMDFFRSVL